ncbi:hypothetical protein F0M18_15110 [Pseudohalioglobus sediminis]|uniref:Hydrogenase expression/formation protein HupK n=1 Tax=Pseudohalioglobus sediminis TaxID=2606449 RepID=A0A5B0WS05_9GAMM|nr:hypothetical protein [Pseudohalioglobus sediminis]KAA1189676.1 hypothetical protein F0M18_15110 [Pseudohalioglobus sediminis]
MTPLASQGPRIEVRLGRGRVDIHQHRPNVLAQLTGMPLAQALALVPRLLPVCGAAQSIAAARAVEAARGMAAEAPAEAEREQQLVREQAAAAGWRLAVDWPDITGAPRQMAWLKRLRDSSSDAQRAALLMDALPGLAGVQTMADLLDWSAAGDGVAAQLLASIGALQQGAASRRRRGDALLARARDILAGPEYDPLAPGAQATEVGPYAMARHHLAAQLEHAPGQAFQRTAALLLDTLAIAETLAGQAMTAPEANSWAEPGRCGTGRAITARGPVFHRVQLAEDDSVAHWHALAPTDWHFAPDGAVANTLAGCSDTGEARLLLAGFDPCVPCTVTEKER